MKHAVGWRARCIAIVISLLWASAAAAEKSLVLLDLPVLIADQNGNASTTLSLRNDTEAPIQQLSLNLTDFMHKRPDGKYYPLGTTRTLATVNNKEQSILLGTQPLAKGATLTLRVTVAKLWEAGQSEAALKNGSTDIPVLGGPSKSSLKAIRIPAAYNLQVISPTPDAPEIHFVGDRALVGLKNSDPFTYRLTWKLRLNGKLFDGGRNYIDLPPGSTKYAYLERPAPNADFPAPGFVAAGTVKDEIVKGNLILEPIFEGDALTQPLPSKDLPVTYRLSYWGDTVQPSVNGVWIFLFLTVGGLFSLWFHSGIPNTTRALTVRRRVRELEVRIRGLGASLSSRWRVLLESHLPGIQRELFSTPWIFPSFATILDGLTKKVEMVQQWVEVAYAVSIVLHQAEQANELIPFTVLRWIEERCDRALTPIVSGLTTDEEIQTMKSNLNAARNYLSLTLQQAANPDLDKEITERETRLKPDLEGLATNYPFFSGLIRQLQDAVGKPLSPENYIDRDSCSTRVDLLRALEQRRGQISDAPDSPVHDALLRLQNHKDWLMTFLVADTHESLRKALLIVNEMHQDIYSHNALTDAVKMDPPALTIITDPAAVQAQTPVRMVLRFNRQVLNQAVARQEWTCTWDFGDKTPYESGWEVFHSYESAGIQHVEVTIRADLIGEPVTSKPIPRDITVVSGQNQTRSRRARTFVKLEPETRLEVVRLVMVLGVALLGLMGTARQQMQNLGFLKRSVHLLRSVSAPILSKT